jgi:uncharacterized protein YbaR (Trm112 family)
MAVELAPELLEILACPNCHGALAVDHDRDELVCTSPDCRLAYPVRDGIPVLLIDEARPPQRRPASDARGAAVPGPSDHGSAAAGTGGQGAEGPDAPNAETGRTGSVGQ